jgi:carbon storage regulator CsrA
MYAVNYENKPENSNKENSILSLTRYEGQSIIVNTLHGDITFHIHAIKGNQVRIGIDAPQEMNIYRNELVDKQDKFQKLREQIKERNEI